MVSCTTLEGREREREREYLRLFMYLHYVTHPPQKVGITVDYVRELEGVIVLSGEMI